MSVDSSDPIAAVDKASVVVPVLDEVLRIEKRVVDRGGVRLSKVVRSREETVEASLSSNSVEVERRTIGRLLDTEVAPPPRQEGNTLIISVVEEVLITEKRLLLKEEVRITRTEAVEHQTQTVSLRSEEVSIERLEPL